jgi:hypothetical protein
VPPAAAPFASRRCRTHGCYQVLRIYSSAHLSLTGPKAGNVDHSIPQARYPFDSPFNLVLASRKENNRMRDELKPEALRHRWLERNQAHFDLLVAPEPEGFGADEADRETAKAVAGWVYGPQGSAYLARSCGGEEQGCGAAVGPWSCWFHAGWADVLLLVSCRLG